MSGKNLTAEQERTSDRIMIESGLKGAAIGLGIGAIATVMTFRRSPEFRALSRPLQSLMTVSSKCYVQTVILSATLIFAYSHYCWFLICI